MVVLGKKIQLILFLVLSVFGLVTFRYVYEHGFTETKKSMLDAIAPMVDDTTQSQEREVGSVPEVTTHISVKEPIDTLIFEDSFDGSSPLEEAHAMVNSSELSWWLNSGAFFYKEGGIGKTVQGKLGKDDPWRIKYRDYDSDETDDGYHPQNIFRLVTKNKWHEFHQEAYFRITADNVSKSEHRMESNGLLLFNRYQDGDTLYYTGIRVDGAAVIKKKILGTYFTMAYEPVFVGKYDRKKRPNLLPKNVWIGIRSEVIDESGGRVSIKVYVDRTRSGNWELVAEAVDDGKSFGGKSILKEGYAGIRTDFMDVEFDEYRIEELVNTEGGI